MQSRRERHEARCWAQTGRDVGGDGREGWLRGKAVEDVVDMEGKDEDRMRTWSLMSSKSLGWQDPGRIEPNQAARPSFRQLGTD